MVVGLTKIRGVGYMFANTIINVLKINPDQRIGYLSSEQVKSIESIIRNPSASNFPSWFLNRRKDVETGEDKHLITSDIAFTVRSIKTGAHAKSRAKELPGHIHFNDAMDGIVERK